MHSQFLWCLIHLVFPDSCITNISIESMSYCLSIRLRRMACATIGQWLVEHQIQHPFLWNEDITSMEALFQCPTSYRAANSEGYLK